MDALERYDPIEATAVRHGEKVITDSRGLRTEPDAVVYNGAIFRLVRARTRDIGESSEI